MRINETEVFEGRSVGGSEFKVGWHVATKFEIVGVMVAIKQFCHAFQLLSLSLRKVLLIGRPTIERQCVVRVLRRFLMENIILAIVPVLEGSIIRAGLLNGSRRLHNFLGLRCGPLPLLALELGFICRG